VVDARVSRRAVSRRETLGIDLIPASAPDFFLEDTPTAVLVRQVLSAIAQFEKASLVAKLKAARDRKRAREGKCEGRKSHVEVNPRCDTFCPNTVSPGLVSKGPLPSAETCRAGTALRSVRTATTRHRCRQKSDEHH
jgi:hypothetical protein